MNKKNSVELIITGVMASLLIILAVRTAGKTKQKRQAPIKVQPGLAAVDISPQSAAEQRPSLQDLEQEVKDLTVKRDPFSPAPVAPTKSLLHGLRLSGIVWDEHNPKAIINDIIVGTDDNIGANIIVEIKQDRVIIFDGAQYYELRLGQ